MTSIVPRESTSFTDRLPESSGEIEAVIREERRQLKASIEQLGSVMKDKVDVRTQFREHPLAAVGVGFAAGIALGVLSTRSSNGHRSSSLEALEDRWTDDAHPQSSRARRSSGGMGKFAAAIMGMVGSRVADLAEDTLRDSLARRRLSVPERTRQHR